MIIPDHAMPIPRLQNNTGHCAKRFAIAATILAVAGFAAADGMMAPRVMEVEVKGNPTVVRWPKQGAILATDGQRYRSCCGRISIAAQASLRGWCPSRPSRPPCRPVTTVSLRNWTGSPRRGSTGRSPSGDRISACLLAAQGRPMSVHEVAAPAVRVESEGTAGMYDYTVLSSDSAGELEKWLHANKYAVPKGEAGVFQEVHRAEMALAGHARAGRGDHRAVLAPHPITYTYRGELVFPMMISTLSAADETEVVLYVVGRTGFRDGHMER